MDLSQHNPESSTSSSEQVPFEPPSSVSTPRNLRSSARVRAAKEKEKEKEREPEFEDRSPVVVGVADSSRSTSLSNQSKRPRAISTSKGKGKETEEPAARPSKKYVSLTVFRQPDRPSSPLPPQSPQGHVPSTILWIIDPRTSSRSQRQETCIAGNHLRRRYFLRLLFNSQTSQNSHEFIFPPFTPRSPPHRTIRDAEEGQVRPFIQFPFTASYQELETSAQRARLPLQRARQPRPAHLAVTMILLKPKTHPHTTNSRMQTKESLISPTVTIMMMTTATKTGPRIGTPAPTRAVLDILMNPQRWLYLAIIGSSAHICSGFLDD
jgi:hypothetical protein